MDDRVEENMSRDVVQVGPNESLRLAYEVMRSHRFRHLPVVEDGRLLGVLSDRDVMLLSQPAINGMVEPPDVTVDEAMSLHPVTCRETSSISQVVKIMLEKKIDCLPVLNDRSKLVGMITSTDLLYLLLNDDFIQRMTNVPWTWQLRSIHELASAAR